MRCPRKLIYPTYSHHLIPILPQIFQIPPQSSRITAHINNPPRPHPHHRFQALLIAPLPGRVHHDHIRINPIFFILPRQHLFRLPHVKFRVRYPIPYRILLRVRNGLRHDLHPIHLFSLLRQKQ